MAQRVKKKVRDNQMHGQAVTKAWPVVRGRCSQAERFSIDIAAVIE